MKLVEKLTEIDENRQRLAGYVKTSESFPNCMDLLGVFEERERERERESVCETFGRLCISL